MSRTRLKDYTLSEDYQKVVVQDVKKQEITFREAHTSSSDNYYLEITSPSKAMTEASMNRQWRECFETEMQRINDVISKKGGTKRYEKVVGRVGRTMERYPSISRFYDITYARSEEKTAEMLRVDWDIKNLSTMDRDMGVYILRTNVRHFDEQAAWDYYNLIGEIECTNRQLKTDLNLCPIYHQKGNRSDAHLFFGLLSYCNIKICKTQHPPS